MDPSRNLSPLWTSWFRRRFCPGSHLYIRIPNFGSHPEPESLVWWPKTRDPVSTRPLFIRIIVQGLTPVSTTSWCPGDDLPDCERHLSLVHRNDTTPPTHILDLWSDLDRLTFQQVPGSCTRSQVHSVNRSKVSITHDKHLRGTYV